MQIILFGGLLSYWLILSMFGMTYTYEYVFSIL